MRCKVCLPRRQRLQRRKTMKRSTFPLRPSEAGQFCKGKPMAQAVERRSERQERVASYVIVLASIESAIPVTCEGSSVATRVERLSCVVRQVGSARSTIDRRQRPPELPITGMVVTRAPTENPNTQQDIIMDNHNTNLHRIPNMAHTTRTPNMVPTVLSTDRTTLTLLNPLTHRFRCIPDR